MKKSFRSKVEVAIAIPVIAALVIIETFMILFHVWLLVILILLISGFLLYLYFATSYEFKDDKLHIKSGFLYDNEIYIRSIKRIKNTRNLHASPALSPDRLEIFYNRYGHVQVSPEEKSEFISTLKGVNPAILVEG
jgi:hypothetical protein